MIMMSKYSSSLNIMPALQVSFSLKSKKRWIDNVREDCAEMSLDIIGATRLATSDRDEWRRQMLKLPEHAIALPGP